MEASDIVEGEGLTIEEVLSRLREYCRRDATPVEKAAWCVDHFTLGVMLVDRILDAGANDRALATEAEMFARNGAMKVLHPALHCYCHEEWHRMALHPSSRLRLFRHAIDAVGCMTGAPVPDTKVSEILKATEAMDGWRPIRLPPPRDRVWDRLRH